MPDRLESSGAADQGDRGRVAGKGGELILFLPFSPCGRRCLRCEASKADEGSLSIDRPYPSPVSISLRSIEPPSPTRGEEKIKSLALRAALCNSSLTKNIWGENTCRPFSARANIVTAWWRTGRSCRRGGA